MKMIKMYGLLYVVAKDKEWGKCCQHSHRTGEPHTESDPGWRRQLFSAADWTVVGHSGRAASVSKAWEQRVRPTKLQQLQQGRGRHMSHMHVFPDHDVLNEQVNWEYTPDSARQQVWACFCHHIYWFCLLPSSCRGESEPAELIFR